MKAIQYRDGDLLTATEDAICHGCNAQGVMGSGVARLIRDKWVVAYEAYREAFLKKELFVGTCTYAYPDGFPIIINAVTQEFYGRDPDVVYVSYDAVRSCVEAINRDLPNVETVAFPLIGAGLANGSWQKIAKIIEDTANFQPIVYLNGQEIPET